MDASRGGDDVVPHLSLLGLSAASLKIFYNVSRMQIDRVCRRATGKTVDDSILQKVHGWSTWNEHVRGNIVSRSAAKLIQSFLLNTMASTGKAIDDDESEADATEDEPEIPPLQLQTDKFQQLLQCADNQDNDTTAQKITRSVARRMSRKAEYQQSHRIGEAIWKTSQVVKKPAQERIQHTRLVRITRNI